MWRQILTYLYIRKRNPDDPRSINVRMMHGMNRISIFIFLLALVVLIVRAIVR
jgi:hypothetical protein